MRKLWLDPGQLSISQIESIRERILVWDSNNFSYKLLEIVTSKYNTSRNC